MASKLEHALALADRGFKVFPVKAGAKAPPLLNNWQHLATSDPGTVRYYWAAVPDANIAIHCEGMIVLDVDVLKGGNESFERLDIIYGFPDTLTCRTPSGGRHVLFHHGSAVSNSVGALGAGLDIRSMGGYIVAPGSSVPAGTYVFDNDTPIADAPEWLVQKLGTFTKREQPVNTAAVPDTTPSALDRAAAWLEGQGGAQQGAGGDAYTYKIACLLRDYGLSELQALALLSEGWNEKCEPPWTPSELGTKVHNAYRYAENAPGVLAVKAEDFDVINPADTVRLSAPLIAKAQRLGDFADSHAAAPGYLVKGLLQRGTYAMLYGAPGEGKTFAALDVAYHVAAGKPWMGLKTHAGPVLYLAYEGAGGLINRAKALRQKYGKDDVPLYIASAAFDLRDAAGRKALGQIIADLPEKPVLIVFDTLAHALCGGDENSAQDMSAFNSGAQALIGSTGACVMVIHHPGKNKSNGARGSSALLAALDTEIQVEGKALIPTKQREMELGKPIGFKLVPIVVGMDEDGDNLTSCVVEPAPVVGSNGDRLTGNAKLGFAVLCDMARDNHPVSEDEWRDACVEEFLGDKDVRHRFSELKLRLKQKGHIVIIGDMITRRLE